MMPAFPGSEAETLMTSERRRVGIKSKRQVIYFVPNDPNKPKG